MEGPLGSFMVDFGNHHPRLHVFSASSSASNLLRMWLNNHDPIGGMGITFLIVKCDLDAIYLRAIFPAIHSFTYCYSLVPLRFVRQFCETFPPHNLWQLCLSSCELRELPRELGKLAGLSLLNVSKNRIHWVHASLHSALSFLRDLDLTGNLDLPRNSQWHTTSRTTTATLFRSVCELDAAFRTKILLFMGLVRKRLHNTRDVSTLLGKAMWELRFNHEHDE